MKKFTPGPYRALVCSNVSGLTEVLAKNPHGSDKQVALCLKSDIPTVTPEEAMANGHLFAAAPDLYDALDILMSWHESDLDDLTDEFLDKARAALAKARGEGK